MEPIIPKEYANRILYTASLCILSMIVAYKCRLYDCMFVVFLVFVSSINYWRNPVYGFSRNIDISIVIFSFVYLLIRSFRCKYQLYYIICMFLAILSFITSYHFYEKKDYDSTSLFHVYLHILSNVSNVILFIGL
jgi:hypothetical protein